MASIDYKIRKNRVLRAKVFARDGFSCLGCGAEADHVPADYDGSRTVCCQRRSGDRYTRYLVVDHILPRSRGGKHSARNCQTLCDSCNSLKGPLTNREWLRKEALCA